MNNTTDTIFFQIKEKNKDNPDFFNMISYKISDIKKIVSQFNRNESRIEQTTIYLNSGEEIILKNEEIVKFYETFNSFRFEEYTNIKEKE